jgi:hypothetical protein
MVWEFQISKTFGKSQKQRCAAKNALRINRIGVRMFRILLVVNRKGPAIKRVG